MVRGSYGGMIGDVPMWTIPFGRMAEFRGTLRRYAYAVMLEGKDDDDTPEGSDAGEPD